MSFELNKIYQGHTLDVIKTFPNESIDCVITSPPYWGLRDYGLDPIIWDSINGCEHEWGDKTKTMKHKSGETNPGKEVWFKNKGASNDKGNHFCLKCSAWRGSLGLEPTPELYIKHLLEIFDEIKRVLKKTGTCWVNLGDSYSGSWGNRSHKPETKNLNRLEVMNPEMTPPTANLKHILAKSLVGIPEMFVLGMRDRGWIRRNSIIWYKRNCMPSSAKDRFTVDWEPVFFFVKSNDAQFWTNEKTLQLVSKQPLGTKGIEGIDWEWKEINGKRKKVSLWSGHDYWFEQQFEEVAQATIRRVELAEGREVEIDNQSIDDQTYKRCNSAAVSVDKYNNPIDHLVCKPNPQGRNKRCVWDIPTQSFSEAHFAVFPEALIEPMIRSGCPEFICKKCGKAREKIYENHREYTRPGKQTKYTDNVYVNSNRPESLIKRQINNPILRGLTDCNCNADFEPGITLDPFIGSGTTALVAIKNRRNFIGIELNQKYIEMAERRIKEVQVQIL